MYRTIGPLDESFEVNPAATSTFIRHPYENRCMVQITDARYTFNVDASLFVLFRSLHHCRKLFRPLRRLWKDTKPYINYSLCLSVLLVDNRIRQACVDTTVP